MPDRTLPPAVGVLDLAAGVCLVAARTAQAGSRRMRWSPPGLGALRSLGAPLVAHLSGDTPEHLRVRGRAARRRAQALAEDWFRAAVPAFLDLVLDQIDLTEVVLRRVDLDRIAATLDVDAVAQRLDLDRVVARLDVDAVAAGIDMDAIIGRLDLIALAEYVVNGIDLPRIIRESTGSVASESLRGVRTRSIEADQALAQFVDKVLLRRRRSGEVRAAENGAGAAAAPPGGDHAD